MSNVYSMEPRTTGKVNINTTHGLLSVELWTKECPLACRNFIQLCLEGYYDQSPFHRLVPGFCLQGGKPEKKFTDEPEDGDGMAVFPTGRFAVESHSRLKFNRRGLLGMVVLNQSDLKSANGSQFFFTLSDAPELNDRATLFGRIVGDTIFNLLRLGELETDARTEAPLYPPRILSAEVVQNPFNDIVPRERVVMEPVVVKQQQQQTTSTALKKKNVSLLSFEDDEKGSESRAIVISEINRKVSKETIKSNTTSEPSHSKSHTSTTTNSLQFLNQMKSVQMRETQDKIRLIEEELGFRSKEPEPELDRNSGKAQKEMTALERHKAKFAQGKKRTFQVEGGKDEVETLLLLNSFRQKIQKTANNSVNEQTSVRKHLDICKLHGLLDCLSCKNNFNVNLNLNLNSDLNVDEKDWMMHKLVFDRRELEGKVREDLKELVVIDPRDQKSRKNK